MFGNKKEKELLRKQREVFDVIGHELRTPLSIIKVNAGLLKVKSASEGEEHLIRIEEALDRASKLLEAMLSTAKIEEGKLELKFDKVELISLIRDSILSVERSAKEKGLNIVINFQTDELFVYADKVRTQQIVDNFLSNAVKYTNNGEIRIKVEAENSIAKVTIEDTGIGISDEATRKLGEKFFRAHDSKTAEEDLLTKPGGTGLGLYIAFNLISAMGGAVNVSSTLGKGSSFSFSLPVYDGQPVAKVEDKEKRDLFKRMGFTQQKS